MIAKNKIEELKSLVHIQDVIAQHLQLTKKGVNYIASCPFHNEKTASFTVNPTKNMYKCFGCGESGDAISFLMKINGMTYPEALHELARMANFTLEYEDNTEDNERALKKQTSLSALNFAKEFFQQQIETNPKAMDYLSSREITQMDMKRFGIGYAPGGWTALYHAALKKGFSEQVLIDNSLINRTEKGIYDIFQERIIFPFFDHLGNILGFTGRSINSDSKLKYLNSKEVENNPFSFHKGQILFGLYQATENIIRTNQAILVEGNIDVITLHRIGVTNTVCGSGTSLTQEQARLIKRFADTVIMIYDGDKAGVKASIRNIETLIWAGLNIKIVPMPTNEDPDSFFKKMSKEDVLEYIKTKAKDFIDFVYMSTKLDITDNPHQQSNVVQTLIDAIEKCPDLQARYRLIERVRKIFSLDEVTFVNIKKQSLKVEENGQTQGFDNDTKEAIKSLGVVNVCFRVNNLVDLRSNGIPNCIYFDPNNFDMDSFTELRKLCDRVVVVSELPYFVNVDTRQLSAEISLCSQLVELHFSVTIQASSIKTMSSSNADNMEIDLVNVNFYDAYFEGIKLCLEKHDEDNLFIKWLVEKTAHILSKADSTILAVNLKRYGKVFGLTSSEFKAIMKPFTDKKQQQDNKSASVINFDGEQLPDYVDHDFFKKWGFFPLEDTNGKKVCYAFKNKDNGSFSKETGGFSKVANFFLEPMFHVLSTNEADNKRIVKVTAEVGPTIYAEISSAAMAERNQFQKWLYNLGPYIFVYGKPSHLELINAAHINDFKFCFELKVYGQQHEGFFAFTNAIVSQEGVTHMNDLGMVEHNERTYYSPSVSKMFDSLRKDDDKYSQDRFLMYKAGSSTTFEQWSGLMDVVYKANDNGKWGVIFGIISAFRSTIYPINRLFTSLFFTGPTDSGKSQIAISIRSLFVHPDAPLFNLNSGTDAAFFTIIERLRDVPVIMEEYNDLHCSDTKFQGLKSAIYDGEGKQKRRDASSKEMDISQVNSVPLLLGQEMPTRDDNALANRCVICHVPKKDDWNDDETAVFGELKKTQKEGLSHILVEILKQRPMIEEFFQAYQRGCESEMKADLQIAGIEYQTRVLNTISMFLATVKIWEEQVLPKNGQLRLPFTYAEFYVLAREKLIAQSENLKSTNKMASFLETVQMLAHEGQILAERDYQIRERSYVTVESTGRKREEITFDKSAKILFMRLETIHMKYTKQLGAEKFSKQDLKNYLTNHPAYIGKCNSVKFNWDEIKQVADELTGIVTLKKVEMPGLTTSAYALNYDLLGIDLGDPSQMVVADTQKTKYYNHEKEQKVDIETELPF